MPQRLDGSDSVISFDRTVHPDYIPHPGRSALVLDPIVGGCQLSKVLMDGGIVINILYAETMEKIGISLLRLWPSSTAFHDIVHENYGQPWVKYPWILFSAPLETSELKRFPSRSSLQGRLLCSSRLLPCVHKVHGNPMLRVLKTEDMLGPNKIIMVIGDFKHYDCEVANVDLAKSELAAVECVESRKTMDP